MIVILNLCNPETLFEPYKSFSFIAKNHNLRYMHVEFLSNQASKQSGTINNVFKMQRVLFYRSHGIENKLLIIIHADKMSVQKETIFPKQNLELLFKSFTLKTIKTECHLMTYLHQGQYHQHKSKSSLL